MCLLSLNMVSHFSVFSCFTLILEFLESDRSADDIRAHREKKRYYKDLVQEEERITTQVRKPADKRLFGSFAG